MKIFFIFVFCCSVFAQDSLFDKYKVDSVYAGPIASPDFKSNKKYIKFKTFINATIEESRKYRNGIFAGHYVVCSWDVYKTCVIVDAISGKIYDGVLACFDYSFKSDSKLLISNPQETSPGLKDCKTQMYVFKNNKFKKIGKVYKKC